VNPADGAGVDSSSLTATRPPITVPPGHAIGGSFMRQLATALLALVAGFVVTAAAPRPAAADDTYTLKLATLAPAKTPWATLLEDYKKAVEKASGGKIKVKVFLGGNLGDENATVRMTSRGQIQGVGASTGALATLVPELDAIEIPFMFRNANEADYVMDKFLLAPMEERFKAHGLILGFWSENGFRHFGSTWGAIKTPKDVENRKMRSQENFTHIEMWKTLKAAAQAIPTPEVSTALKTSAVEGFDQALLFMIAAGWHSQVKHVTLSAHIYQPAAIAFNKDWFDKLPADLQKVLIDEGRAIVRKGRESIRKMNPKLVDIVKKAKVQIHTLSDAERAEFEKATAGVRETVRKRDTDTAKVVELIEAGLKEFRAKSKK
jgi:TRAP-type transport system periplasmic protein